jgi:hypothetical protein
MLSAPGSPRARQALVSVRKDLQVAGTDRLLGAFTFRSHPPRTLAEGF